MHVLGCDPGLANFGFAVVRIDAEGYYQLVETGVWTTTKSKQKIRVAVDNLRRAQILAGCMDEMVKQYSPVAVLTEGMSFPQNSSAATKLALSWGALAGLTATYDLPVEQVSPQDIKKQLCGKRNASKLEVEETVKELAPPSIVLLNSVAKGKREHAVDAFAAVICSLDSEVVKMARKFA